MERKRKRANGSPDASSAHSKPSSGGSLTGGTSEEQHPPRTASTPSSTTTTMKRNKHEPSSSSAASSFHPYGVKPWGNFYFSDQADSCRDSGLGAIAVLEDSVVMELLHWCSAKDLCCLAQASKALYVFCHEEEPWKALCLSNFGGDFQFQGSWKETYQHKAKPDFAVPHVPLQVTNFYSDTLLEPWHCITMSLERFAAVDNIDRRSGLSVEDFIAEYETPNKPVIITDIVTDWPAFKEQKWSKENLLANYGDIRYKTGTVEMRLRDYFQYCEQCTREETPLYLFDNQFAEKAPQWLDDYQIPPYFREDLFALIPATAKRPSYRWNLIGPARSGSTFHKDPNSTSAWNGLISGRKKWILYPPNISPPGIYPSEDHFQVTCPVSVLEWFLKFYDQVHHKHSNEEEEQEEATPSFSFLNNNKKREPHQQTQPIECVLRAGELLFIPNGWWHTALNLEESIAVTQNYVNPRNLQNVLKFLRAKENPRLLTQFTEALREQRPQLLEEAERSIEQEKRAKLSLWDKLTQDNHSFSLFGNNNQ
ncbi:tRNA wybutosine-synthesizing protein 4 [Balamuthia mandrillaris]